MLPKIEKQVGAVKGKTIAVLGLAFKPETNDIREAPALDIIQGLLERGAKVRAYDPVAMDETAKVISNICYAEDEYEAVNDADALVIVTEWNSVSSPRHEAHSRPDEVSSDCRFAKYLRTG